MSTLDFQQRIAAAAAAAQQQQMTQQNQHNIMNQQPMNPNQQPMNPNIMTTQMHPPPQNVMAPHQMQGQVYQVEQKQPQQNFSQFDSTPPTDQALKHTIDKLAEFVGKNGSAFEETVKAREQNNPKFSFLFGGANHGYYLHALQHYRSYYAQKQKQKQQHVDVGGLGWKFTPVEADEVRNIFVTFHTPLEFYTCLV